MFAQASETLSKQRRAGALSLQAKELPQMAVRHEKPALFYSELLAAHHFELHILCRL